jgi:hypothetical protein
MTIVERPAVSAAKVCSINGCGKPHKAHGWCNPHYRRWQRTGDPLGRKPSLPKVCSIEDCESPMDARGWCNAHYLRWRKHGDPRWTPPLPLCSIEGCGKPHHARGWCEMHYDRWERNGDPLVLQFPVAVPAYTTVHCRLRAKQLASTLPCAHCGGQADDWAYDHADPNELTDPRGLPYSADPRHYIPLCKACHTRFDRYTDRSAVR